MYAHIDFDLQWNQHGGAAKRGEKSHYRTITGHDVKSDKFDFDGLEKIGTGHLPDTI